MTNYTSFDLAVISNLTNSSFQCLTFYYYFIPDPDMSNASIEISWRKDNVVMANATVIVKVYAGSEIRWYKSQKTFMGPALNYTVSISFTSSKNILFSNRFR